EAHLYDAVETTVSDYMDQGFQGMKSKLKEGGYSSNETIFLDYLSASAVAQGLGIAAQIGHESIKSKADAAVAEAEETWKEIKKRPMMVEKLTDEEIMAVYAEEGVTYDTIVDSVKTHFNEKVTASQTLMATFTALGSQIETGIQELIAQDETLAGDITGWINGN
ncbi:triacylglycerol lipase, partial [Streptococcus dentapri]